MRLAEAVANLPACLQQETALDADQVFSCWVCCGVKINI
jgi:hypothetical protein